MSDEIIEIEESEATTADLRDGSDTLYIRMRPSPKAERIQRESRVTFKGVLYAVSSRAQFGDGGGGPVEFHLLKVNKAVGGVAGRG
ncbi:MAG TPA: hypothetical protein VN282_05730 [Pyrinomonadaceae bacterium]|nr:hypothetical protein [Pyrinomonadaceae bacterium]